MTFDPNEPLFPPGFPDEFKEQILEHRRTHLAYTQDNTHAVRMLLDDLDADQLKAFDLILAACIEAPEYNLAYFRGQVTQLLHLKFDQCPCGQTHDPHKAFQLPEITRPGAPTYPNEETEMDGRPIEDTSLPPERSFDQLLETYNLEQSDHGMNYTCKGCGQTYVTLADRMVKPPGPEGCDGCIQKEKWG